MNSPAQLMQPTRWQHALGLRARLLHQQIASLQRLTSEFGSSPELLESSCTNLYALLDQLYLHDLPIAKAIDESDLLLHLDGEYLHAKSPPIQLITSIMSDVRKQVGTLVKTLATSLNESLQWPKEFDFGLTSFAPGSLYLGFALPRESLLQPTVRQNQQLIATSEKALQTFGDITSLLGKRNPWPLICERFPDPKLRDSALSAVAQLSPTGRRGVSYIEISGRSFVDSPWRRLDPQSRSQVRSWLEQSASTEEVEVDVNGTIRAVDLDFRRCDLRRPGLPDVRCIYPAEFDSNAGQWLNKSLQFQGLAELWEGEPRLLKITQFRLI